MNFNRKILNWSIIIILLITYIIPGKSSDGFAFNYGYPFRFFTMYNTEINAEKTLFDLTSINIGGFILNILIIYYLLNIINKFIKKRLISDQF